MKIVIKDFYADWCGPCKMVAPILKEIASEFEEVELVKIDVDNAHEEIQDYNIRSIPTIVFEVDGNIVKTTVGAYPKNKYIEIIKEILGEN